MLSTIYDAVTLLRVHMSTAADALSAEGLEAAVDTAMSELGWTTFPITDVNQCAWILNRAKRHACYILWVASAQKFKYKQVNLQQRFEHYEKLIRHMDREYEEALQTNTALFCNIESYKMFGTVVGAGFNYDAIGNDITYDDLILYVNTEV